MPVELFIHLPLPYFNSDQMIRTMSSNRSFFMKSGVFVPDPASYRPKLLSNIRYIEKNHIPASRIPKMSWQNYDAKRVRRIVVSLPHLFLSTKELIGNSGLLPNLNTLVKIITCIFRDYEIKLLIGTVNPGNLIGTVAQSESKKNKISLREISQYSASWYDTIGACIDVFPEIDIVLWKHEKSHVNWSNIIGFVGGIDGERAVPGSLDMISQILTEEGLSSIIDHLKRIPPQNHYHFEKVLESYVKRYPNSAWSSRRIRLKGWNSRIAMAFENSYLDDLSLLGAEGSVFFLDSNQASQYRKLLVNAEVMNH